MPFEKVPEITEKQAEVWKYLVEHVCEFGYQPSMTEMAEHFGVSLKAVRDRVLQLAAKGFIGFSHKHADRSLILKCVRFEAVFSERPPKATGLPDEMVPPQWWDVRDEVRKLLKNGKRLTMRELFEKTGTPKTILNRVLNHFVDDFESVPLGRTSRWFLRDKGH